jgi:hypothetical protein
MNFLRYFLFLIIPITLAGQDKEININTGNPFLCKKNIDVFSNPIVVGSDEENWRIDKISLGKVVINSYREDTFIFKVKGKMPVLIIGLTNINSEKVIISNIPNTNYNPIDSIITTSVEYYNKDSLDQTTEKAKIRVPNNSKKFKEKTKIIKINNTIYYSNIISFPDEEIGWYCTRGKISYHQFVKKVDKYYLFEIIKF